jgi:hypothetical protein
MINFLTAPEKFNLTTRLASQDRATLTKIAVSQLKQAKSIREVYNFISNAVTAGIAWIKDLPRIISEGFTKLLQSFIVKTPVIRVLTSYFQRLAYDRLLVILYDSWNKGGIDKTRGNPLKDEEDFKDYTGKYGYYDAYVLGYQLKNKSVLSKLAEDISKKELGERTVSLIARDALRAMNPFIEFSVFTTLKYEKKGKLYKMKSAKNLPLKYMFSLMSKLLFLCLSAPVLKASVAFALPPLVGLALMSYSSKEVFTSPKAGAITERVALNLAKMLNKVTFKDLYSGLTAEEVFIEENRGEFSNVLEVVRGS